MGKYILALDQGQPLSRAILFDKNQQIAAAAQREFSQIYPREGWVEHDPMEIWSSQYSVITELLAKSGVSPCEIAALGITNQRETTIVWDRQTGKPVYHAIVWQCRRTAPMIESLVKEGFSKTIQEKTGLIPDAYFSASKLHWILGHVEGAKERAQKGGIIVWNSRYLAYLETDRWKTTYHGSYQCLSDNAL